MKTVNKELGQLITPTKLRRAGTEHYPILSMTMHNGLVDQKNKFKKRVASKDTSQYKIVKKNQLVVGFPIDEGVLSFQKLYDEAIVSPAYDIWTIKYKEHIDSSYLERFLRSPRALCFYVSKLRSTTARRRTLPKDVFLSLPVPLPQISEQKRIAGILDMADVIRHKREKTITLATDLLRATFIDMFGDPASNPKGWEWGTIRELVSEVKYGTSQKADVSKGNYPILRMNNLTYEGQLDISDLKYVNLTEADKKKYLAKKGDLLFNRTNSRKLVGKTAVYDLDYPMAIAGYLIRVRANEKANSYYISGYLNSKHGKQTLEAMCKSIVGMANINAQELQNIKILKPPTALQHKYAEMVHTIKLKKEKLLDSASQADVLFKSLSQQAFRGDL